MKPYDLIILGGGRASNLAIAAGKQGMRVALIEKDALGGTCPNRGCVPSKLLIGYADVARNIRESHRFFISAEIRKIDVAKIFAETNDWIGKVDSRYEGRLPESVDLYRGQGHFVNSHEVSVNGNTLTSKTIVVATGSRSAATGYDDLPVWTSENLFPLAKPPSSITIVGGGYIACELGNFFHEIDIDTRLVVRGDRLLEREDSDIVEIFTREFSARVPTSFNSSIRNIKHDGSRFHLEFIDRNGNVTDRTSDAVLFATGRVPNTDDVGLENTDLNTDKRGFLVVDDNLQSSVPGIYAAGDVAGNYMFASSAESVGYFGFRQVAHGMK